MRNASAPADISLPRISMLRAASPPRRFPRRAIRALKITSDKSGSSSITCRKETGDIRWTCPGLQTRAQICRLPGEQAQLCDELTRAETGDDGRGRPRGYGPDDLYLSGINQDQVMGSLAGTEQQRARFHLLRRSVGLQPRPLLIAERRERLIAVVGHRLSRRPCGACGGLPGPADGRVVVFRARRFAVRAARRAPLDLYLPHCVSFLPCWLRWSAVVTGDPATRAASGPCSQVAGAAASAASWRTQRIRSAAAWGWSPNSCAIRLTQPRVPNRRTARLIAAATLSAAGAADRCSAEANSASHHASSTFSRVLAVLPAVDVLDEVVTVSLLTSRLPGSIGAEEAGHTTGLDDEGDIIDGNRLAVALGEVPCLDHCSSVPRCSWC